MKFNFCEIWAVAAYYILEHGTCHYDWDITIFIKKSGLTGLGKKGITPERTVESIFSKSDIFRKETSARDGYYGILDSDKEWVRNLSEVQQVYRQIELKNKFNEEGVK